MSGELTERDPRFIPGAQNTTEEDEFNANDAAGRLRIWRELEREFPWPYEDEYRFVVPAEYRGISLEDYRFMTVGMIPLLVRRVRELRQQVEVNASLYDAAVARADAADSTAERRVLLDRDTLRQFLREIREVARSTAPELGRSRVTMSMALEHVAQLADAALEQVSREAK